MVTMYYSTKTYGNDRGLSCCFRQWKANHSHCSQLHGYSIGIRLIFQAETLDDRNWVQDFGGLNGFKQWAEYMFDHTLIVAEDDPELIHFEYLDGLKVANLRVVDAVGCEKFAELCYNAMNDLLKGQQRVKLKSVEVFEHGANSAIYEGAI